MERLFILDAKDYDEGMPEISRTAVRAVISIEDELLCIEDKTGGVKLPGGGQEDGEDDLTTLAREIREETGHALIPSSVVPFGYVEEKRLTVEGDRIYVAKQDHFDWKTVQGWLEKLEKCLEGHQDVKKVLHEILPAYHIS